MRIGVISDTHGLLRPEVLEVFSGVDHIVHAGDIGGSGMIDALRRLAPVTSIPGNNDDADGLDIARVKLGALRILITHVLPRPTEPGLHVIRSLQSESADLIVFGHSHLPHNEVIGGVCYFNPASAGPRRFDYPVSVGIVEDGLPKHVALDQRSVGALKTRMNQMR